MRIGRLHVVATVTLDGGSKISSPDDERPFDRIQFERRYRESWPIVREKDPTVLDEDGLPERELALRDEHWLFMAWVQTHRQEIAAGTVTLDSFDSWLVTVDSVELDFVKPPDADEGDVSLPTVSTASTGV